MEKFRFLKWEVYNDAKILASEILKIVKKLPSEYRFELGSQIIRSSFSIALNIAEGSGKASDKELIRYFNISVGSANETLASLDIFMDNKLISKEEFEKLFMLIMKISSQLGAFKKRLKVDGSHKS